MFILQSTPLQLMNLSLDFELPPELEASEPPEARGLARDEVRLMVSYQNDNRVFHSRFRSLPEFLTPGDLLVVNTSGTLNAALAATRADETTLELHLSTRLPAGLWLVEVREPAERATRPFLAVNAGETLDLPDGATVTLHTPYQRNPVSPQTLEESSHKGANARLWIATLHLPELVEDRQRRGDSQMAFYRYLEQYGFPIRYRYVKKSWPLSYYQTVYATEPGSAEMPSAGRAFTPELLTQLVARGIHIAPLILHTGVASLERHEAPYEEFYRVPLETARLVNTAHSTGRRVIAVGTTVVRALETVTDEDGVTHPGEGWTRLVVTPERGVRAIHGLLTGLHEPQASHQDMLAALAGREHLQVTYQEALREGYLWHEFGDLHLILP
jgi:S-adenosylmethionine:tRNA ribosyltransferase-isomerase